MPTSAVTKAVAPVRQIVNDTTQSVGKVIDQAPVVKSVAKVLGSLPGAAGGSLPGLPGIPGTTPGGPSTAPGAPSTATGAASTVKSVVTKVGNLASSATGLLGH